MSQELKIILTVELPLTRKINLFVLKKKMKLLIKDFFHKQTNPKMSKLCMIRFGIKFAGKRLSKLSYRLKFAELIKEFFRNFWGTWLSTQKSKKISLIFYKKIIELMRKFTEMLPVIVFVLVSPILWYFLFLQQTTCFHSFLQFPLCFFLI